MRNALWLCSALLVFSSGCVLRVPSGGYSPAPVNRKMTRNEAVDYAFGECRSRGLDCRVKDTDLKHGGDVWKVKMRAYGHGRKGHLHLEYDAWSRRLLRADSNLHAWRRHTPPRWGHDDDWDDDNDGVADWKDRRRGPPAHAASAPRSSSKDVKPASHQKRGENNKRSVDDDDDDKKRKTDAKSGKASSKESRH